MEAQFYNIRSDSQPLKVYTVRHMPDGEWRCSCPGFIFRNQCKHIGKVKSKQN